MYGVFNELGERIGTVVKFAGEPPKTRWVAYASEERRQGFPTRREAIAWLEKLDNERRATAGKA